MARWPRRLPAEPLPIRGRDMSQSASLDRVLASALDLSARQLDSARADDWESVAALQQELAALFAAQEIRQLADGAEDQLRAALSELANQNDSVLGLAMGARDRIAQELGELRIGQQAKRAYSDVSS